MTDHSVTRFRYRLPRACRGDLTYSPTEFSACLPYTMLPKAEVPAATKIYVLHRRRFIREQLDCTEKMEELRKNGGLTGRMSSDFLAEHKVFWRRPYVPEEDPDRNDYLGKLCFLSCFRLVTPTVERAYPVRRSVHTLPNSRVEEHITQPILWEGLKAFDREFGMDDPTEDLATYLAKFLASQSNISGDNMPRVHRYGRSPILRRNS